MCHWLELGAAAAASTGLLEHEHPRQVTCSQKNYQYTKFHCDQAKFHCDQETLQGLLRCKPLRRKLYIGGGGILKTFKQALLPCASPRPAHLILANQGGLADPVFCLLSPFSLSPSLFTPSPLHLLFCRLSSSWNTARGRACGRERETPRKRERRGIDSLKNRESEKENDKAFSSGRGER